MDVPREIPRSELNSMDSRCRLSNTLSRFSANAESAMGNTIAKESRLVIDNISAVSIAVG